MPTQEFFHTEGPGGVLLLISSMAALALANSPWRGPFEHLLETRLAIQVGGYVLEGDLRELINDGLMTVFF